VGLTRNSDSIIMKVVREIAECRLVLADDTTAGHLLWRPAAINMERNVFTRSHWLTRPVAGLLTGVQTSQ
jgi:hypothetical protein